jgi:hypothetical protein
MQPVSTAHDELRRDRLMRSGAKESKTQLDHLLPNRPNEADFEPGTEGKVHQRLPEVLMQGFSTASLEFRPPKFQT